ncbi:LptE family protein [Pedobacter namyangjuensis]|uniref:LptE family protein n=1 Tax=Pedobacter namyangjuensis TaxID=600626 RepID=UPI000DE4D0AB|nr:LptE family protein [Pedobacter namyangjuensis]
MKKLIYVLVVFAFLLGCGYKFNGASIPPQMKTVNVEYFENNAPLVVPTLSQQLTEDLKERIRNQSKLSITPNNPDGVFTGKITGYEIKPIAIQDNQNPIAGANRLTITVMVKYANNVDTAGSKANFEESFSAFVDFSLAGQTLQSQEQSLIKRVNTQLTENIFNRAFAQW